MYNTLHQKEKLKDETAINSAQFKPYLHTEGSPSPIKQPQNSPKTQKLRNALKYSELVDNYIMTKLQDGKISDSTAIDYRNRLDNFTEIIGDVPVSEIDRQTTRKFREILRQLPPNRKKSKKHRNKSIDDILKLSPNKTIKDRTVNEITTALSSLFQWAIQEQILCDNPAKGLKIKEKTPDIEKRDPFTTPDIQKIFMDVYYLEDKFINAAYFWCPLIALYTGMRLEEIAQLHRADIYEHTDENGSPTWVIDIKEESGTGKKGDKKLKNRAAKRIIPIHNDLIEIGLLKYHRQQPRRQTRLFPELNKSSKGGKYGKQVGKQFSALLKRTETKTNKKSFHSLRHTFRDKFKKKDLSNSILYEVLGHSSLEPTATRGYGSAFSPKEKYDRLISLLEFPLDKEMLSKSKFAQG